MSVAVGFRALQAIHDLADLIAETPESTLRRLASGVPTADMPTDDACPAIMRLVQEDRCRFTLDPAEHRARLAPPMSPTDRPASAT